MSPGSLRIGVFGKGRLGGAIARAAGEELTWAVGRGEPPDRPVDVAIEAGAGAAVLARIDWAVATDTPLVVGSTGYERDAAIARADGRIGLLLAPNFSLGVALYARFVRVLARFAAPRPDRDPYVIEHHHARKLDAPSGTAKMLAEAILAECPRKERWVTPSGLGALSASDLSVSTVRAGATWSSHRVGLDGGGEVLELVHEARDASPYAEGALTAARWLVGKRGVFTMDDVARDVLDPLFAREAAP